MTLSEPGPQSIRITAEVPETWATTENRGPFALIAKAPTSGDFAANLTVAVVPFDISLGPETYLAAQVVDLCSVLTDTVIVEASVHESGTLVFIVAAHATGGDDLTMVQTHRLGDDGFAVVASVTGADADWPNQAGDLLDLVVSVRRTDEASAVER